MISLRYLLAILAVISVIAVTVTSVMAHTYAKVNTSTPAANSKLQQSPDNVCIEFTGVLETSLSQIKVTLVEGEDEGENLAFGELKALSPHVLCTDIPQLRAGLYTVLWSIVGRDGHRTSGSYNFEIL